MAKSKHNQSRFSRPGPQSPKVPPARQMTSEGLLIAKKLESIIQDSLDTQTRLKQKHSEWIESDARLTVFANISNGLTVTYLSVIFIETSINNKKWWQDNFSGLTSNGIKINQQNYTLNTRHNFGMLLFILVEKMFRVFLRAIDSVACNRGTADFESIYACLLRTKIPNHPPESFELLELIRLVRNTIHNDGIYLHKKELNNTVTYKGVNYDFINGKPIKFVTWEFLLMLAADIHNLFATIVPDKAIAEIGGNIIDPTYNPN